jgi:hypothetical protein
VTLLWVDWHRVSPAKQSGNTREMSADVERESPQFLAIPFVELKVYDVQSLAAFPRKVGALPLKARIR